MTAQYQSFPGAAGASRTLDKLKALTLPDLAGRSFLDVGCNEGFFCGFARYLGATRVLGIDHGARFVARAREHFPDCEFRHQGWDTLPDEQFDVILLASALHYADDQPALIRRLVERLTPRGVLVLELGIVSSPDSEWVKVVRGIDERMFPTMEKLREELADFAWKWMGPSITQDGDPVKRHVLHISRRLPVAYLLMQPPGFGKTSVGKRLFPRAQVKLVSGDQLLGLVARGQRKASPALTAHVVRDHSPFRLDRLIGDVLDAGLLDDLVQLWLGAAGNGDFAMDMYVPMAWQPQVEQALAERGYLPVNLRWERPGPPLLGQDAVAASADAFYLAMAGESDAVAIEAAGFVDEVELGDDRLTLRGWAVGSDGALPATLQVRVGGRDYTIDTFERQLRSDVQAHLGLPHGLFGWRASLRLEGPVDAAGLPGTLEVAGRDRRGQTTAFRFSAPAQSWGRADSGG